MALLGTRGLNNTIWEMYHVFHTNIYTTNPKNVVLYIKIKILWER